MERKRNINSIIHDQLLGQLSEEEEKRLQVWIESSLENKENYESLMRDTDLSERYRQFATVDEEQAWKKFQEKHFQAWYPSQDALEICCYLYDPYNYWCCYLGGNVAKC